MRRSSSCAGARPTQLDKIVGDRTSPVRVSSGPGIPATRDDSRSTVCSLRSLPSRSAAISIASVACRSTSRVTPLVAQSPAERVGQRHMDVIVTEIDGLRRGRSTGQPSGPWPGSRCPIPAPSPASRFR